MDTIRVARLQVRYRLPASRRAECERLDRVLRAMLDDSLELALERAGLDGREEICVRRVHVPARLRMGLGDDALRTTWGLALADTIRETVVRGGPDVVRYRSRAHALADLLAGAATGDLRRAWAWRQLGLWRGDDVASPRAAGEEAAWAMVSEPASILPALTVAARVGFLPRLLRVVPTDAWIAVALAALREVGADAVTSLEPSLPAELAIGSRSSDSVHRTALVERVLRTSAIARAATREPDGGTLRALAVLALLEVEPAVFRDAEVARNSALSIERALHASSPMDEPTGSGDGDADRRSTSPAVNPDGAAGEGAGPVATPKSRRRAPESLQAEGSSVEVQRADRLDDSALEESEQLEGFSDEFQPLLWPRVAGETRWAGLLFLLNVVSEPGIADEIIRSEPIGSGSFRYVMHRLALTLVPVEPLDAAALAFAGLAPDRPVPEASESPSQEDDDGGVNSLANRVTLRLAERLGLDPPADPRAAAALLRRICRRRGTIVADPGWLEVRLSLDEVSTDIRRAGLDLDPGWLPWLGVVVRFVYE